MRKTKLVTLHCTLQGKRCTGSVTLTHTRVADGWTIVPSANAACPNCKEDTLKEREAAQKAK